MPAPAIAPSGSFLAEGVMAALNWSIRMKGDARCSSPVKMRGRHVLEEADRMLSNLRGSGIKLKIGIGFGSLLGFLAVMGTTGYRAAVVNEQTSVAMQICSSKKDLTRRIQLGIAMQRIGVRDVLMGRGTRDQAFEVGHHEVLQAMDELHALGLAGDDEDRFQQLRLIYDRYSRFNAGIIALYQAGSTGEAVQMQRSQQSGDVSTSLSRCTSTWSMPVSARPWSTISAASR